MLIAFLDPGDAQHQRAVGELRRRLADAEQLIVGTSVYAEVMIRPLQQGTDAKVDEFLDATGTLVLAVNRSLAGVPPSCALATARCVSATRSHWRPRWSTAPS